ncbi:MAG: methyltransferase domain-containing protein [Thermoproteus sp.]
MSFLTRFVEDLNVTRYYGDFIKAGGGLDEVRNALRWSVWYALKWWYEIYREGLHKSGNIFVRALYLSLLENGYIDREGRIVKRVKEPRPPVNSYAAEFVGLHESFDKIGAVKIATDQVDENTVGVLLTAMLSQGWYDIMRITFYRLVGVTGARRLFVPILKEGHDVAALLATSQSPPELIVGYDYRPDFVELAREVLGRNVAVGSCPGQSGICVFQATSSCEVADALGPQFARSFDSALLFHSLYWMLDPVKDLQCMRRLMKPDGRLLVGQQVIESTPGLVAMVASMGAKHVFRSSDVDNMLAAAGFKRERLYLRTMPFYIAVWRS